MYKRVLVPLDGSNLSLQALTYAQTIAEAFRSKVDLLRAVPTVVELIQDASASGQGRWGITYEEWEAVVATLRHEAEDHLAQVAKALAEGGLEVAGLVVDGDPARTIIEEAKKVNDTIIAITTHGRSGITRWWLGSVADKVVRSSRGPVLVVRATEEDPSKQEARWNGIVLPLDGSLVAEQALPHAAALAQALQLPIKLVRAVDPLAYGNGFTTYAQLVDELNADARAYLAGVTDRLRKEGLSVEPVVATGHPTYVILDSLQAGGQQLAVMATHGWTGASRLLLGSITDRIVRHASGPVLVVPAERHQV